MENASKALIIAGGILLAIMTLSLVVYMSTATGRFAKAQNQKKLTEQITAFNGEYEAYNKKRMYGTDIITVVNKAIEHNKKIGVITTDPYYINIKIETIEKFQTTVDKIDNTQEYPEPVTLRETQITDDIKDKLDTANHFNLYFEEGSGELGDWDNNGREFVMNNNFQEFFKGDTEDKSVTVDGGRTTYIMYSALKNFKRAIFECKVVTYSNETGRIEEMSFKQIRTSTGT